ncbi:MAG: VCBS repeat-containing protein [Paludibacteraceae bacterium]|nr:VCBS repeat-containing protein [Paludibacteraceae bacterium]
MKFFKRIIFAFLYLLSVNITAQDFIIPGEMADIKFADLDGDGFMDVIFNGNNGTTGKAIALNDGTGMFSRSVLEVGNAAVSCGFADFDNNGLLDYYVFGNYQDGNAAVFLQNVDGSFSKDASSFAAYNFIDPDVTVVDFNNDGFSDLFVVGWENVSNQRFSGLFLNDGNGRFTLFGQSALIRKGYGSAVWADINADGWPDLLLNGDGGADGEDSNDVYRLYRNNKGVLEAAAVFSDYRQISIGDGARMVDWNNDGKTDVILSGWSKSLNRQATALFTGVDIYNFTFEAASPGETDFPGVSESSIETADLNNDGRIDLLLSGFNGSQTTQVGKYNRDIFGYYLNQTAKQNKKPWAPGMLLSTVEHVGNDNIVTLSWNSATDDITRQASLTYNLSLRNKDTGRWLYNPLAIFSGTNNGWRRISAHGNVFWNRRWVLRNLPEGNYEWTVQAIDANMVGGSFAFPRSFSVVTSALESIKDKIALKVSGTIFTVENQSAEPITLTLYNLSGNVVTKAPCTDSFSFDPGRGVFILKYENKTGSFNRIIML